MKPYQIPDELEYHSGKFPRQALMAVIANQEEMIPELLKVIEYTTENLDALIDDPEYMAHIYAMFLLAQFREKRAYPLLIKLFSTPNEGIGDFVGDVITEDLNRMLASVYDGDVEAIKTLVENEQVDEYVRSAALKSLTTLFVQGKQTRDEILEYFKSLFHEKLPRTEAHIWSSLVYECVNLYPDILYDDIKQVFVDDLIEPFFIDLIEVDEYLQRSKESVLEELKANHFYTLIDDTIAEMENWAAFRPSISVKPMPVMKKVGGQVIREGRKIGRNEPCPCGSGLKYKKCCGKRG